MSAYLKDPHTRPITNRAARCAEIELVKPLWDSMGQVIRCFDKNKEVRLALIFLSVDSGVPEGLGGVVSGRLWRDWEARNSTGWCWIRCRWRCARWTARGK